MRVVFVEVEGHADALEVDADALVGVVAEDDVDGENASGVRGFFAEFVFVEVGIGPGLRGDGHALVGFEGSGLERGLLLSDSKTGGEKSGGKNLKTESKGSHPGIINVSHIDAFDSWGSCRVALHRAPLVRGGARTDRSHT